MYSIKNRSVTKFDLKWKCCKHQSCRTHLDVQLFLWLSFHVTKFEQFKFWISLNDNFKQNFETPNDLNSKSHEHKSCSTHRALQLLFGYFFIRQSDIYIVHKFINLSHSLWNHCSQTRICEQCLLKLCRMMKWSK